MNNPFSPDDRRTVLVVDEETDTADIYTKSLSDTYTVRTAYSGEEALTELDADIDVVLLDRRMPGMSGDEVLEEIEARGLDCRTVLVTGVDPEIGIMELPFDEYLVKPVSSEKLRDAVERMVVRNTHDERIQRVVALASKMSTLEAKLSIDEMRASDEYAELEGEYTELLEEPDSGNPDGDLYTEFSVEKLQTLFA